MILTATLKATASLSQEREGDEEAEGGEGRRGVEGRRSQTGSTNDGPTHLQEPQRILALLIGQTLSSQ